MKKRIISAVIAILIAIPFVVLGGMSYSFAIGVLSILALKEILDLKKAHNNIPTIAIILSILCYLLIIYTDFNGNNFAYGSTYMHLILLPLLLFIPTLFYKKDKYTTQDASYLIGAILFLGIAFNCFIVVREAGIKTFLYLITIPMITDSAAMITGSKIGKNKLCPSISPNKTVEGTIGGSLLGTILPSILYYLLFGSIETRVIFGIFILSIMGQIGDLIFSKIKRENGIKDFSKIMPGHGGILDRLDSTIVIFMTYVFLTYILF